MIDVAMQLAIRCLVPLEFIIFKAVPQNIISYVGGILGHTSNKLLISLVSHTTTYVNITAGSKCPSVPVFGTGTTKAALIRGLISASSRTNSDVVSRKPNGLQK
jgi:hypothetical protein